MYWPLKLTVCKILPWEVQPPHFSGEALLRCSSTVYLLMAALGLSCSSQGLHCSIWDPLLWHKGFSLVVALGLSCPVACGILVPQPGIEPESPALEGGFLTTRPPGKSIVKVFNDLFANRACLLLYPRFLAWRCLVGRRLINIQPRVNKLF